MPTNLLGQWIPEGSQSFATALADIYRHLGVFIRASTRDDFRQKVAAAVSAGLMTVSPGEPALGFVGGRLMSFDGTRVRAISSRQMVTGTIAGSKPVPHSTGNQPGATYEVVFPEPFISVPRVMVQVDNSARLTVAPNTVTSSGFRISVDNRSGVNVPAGSYSLSYQALE